MNGRRPANKARIPLHLRSAYDAAESAGWQVWYTKGGHLLWWPPGARRGVVTSSSGNRRGHAPRAERAALRRAGLDLP